MTDHTSSAILILTDKQLDAEIGRLCDLKAQAIKSIAELRNEKSRRMDVELARLQKELDALQ